MGEGIKASDSLLSRIVKNVKMLKGSERKLIKSDKDLQLDEINRKLDLLIEKITPPETVVDDFQKLPYIGEGKEDLIYLNKIYTFKDLHSLGKENFGKLTKLKGSKLDASYEALSKEL